MQQHKNGGVEAFERILKLLVKHTDSNWRIVDILVLVYRQATGFYQLG